MSDFDAALERLLTDPGFARALAANPGAALAGYRLSGDELAVLSTQLTESAGGSHLVEARTNQSSLAGMLNPLTATGDLLGQGPPAPAERGLGAAPMADLDPAPEQGLGAAPERGLGKAPVAEVGPGTGGEAASSGIGLAPALPEGYETRVDVDGDGVWDAHTLRAAPGGGVEIHVDQNGDGQSDFIGHDDDADGLINWSEYDGGQDGTFETRMYDDNGDGWMDREETGHSG
jgi:hypothetical protein